MRRSLPIVLFALTGCELERLPTVGGEHVVYHWSAGSQLCGGTVANLDRQLEAMTSHYGWSGPAGSVEYFWDAELALSGCSDLHRSACARRFSTRTIVLSHDPLHTHELGHATRVGAFSMAQEYVSFIEEGFATRWESSDLQLRTPPTTSGAFLNEHELRVALEADDAADISYGDAFTWWIALELRYGPGKMAEFVTEIEGARSADEVEAALRRVFDITLAESAALAEDLPSGSMDDPACEFEGLPTFGWTGEPLVVERDHAACEDQDIVNLSDWGASWLFALDFPNTPTLVEVDVIGPDDEDPTSQWVHLTWCSGEFHVGELPSTLTANAGSPGSPAGPWKLRGRYVGALRGPLQGDGAVALPRVVFRQAPP